MSKRAINLENAFMIYTLYLPKNQNISYVFRYNCIISILVIELCNLYNLCTCIFLKDFSKPLIRFIQLINHF